MLLEHRFKFTFKCNFFSWFFRYSPIIRAQYFPTLIRFVGVVRHFMKSLSTIYFQLCHFILCIPADANKSVGEFLCTVCLVSPCRWRTTNCFNIRVRKRARNITKDNVPCWIHITTNDFFFIIVFLQIIQKQRKTR